MVPIASLALVFDLLAKDNASPAFRRVGDEAEKAGKKTSAFGSLTAKAMGAAAGAIAGVGIGSMLSGAVRAASDLNETVNKANVIFGSNARQVRQWAQGSAQAFGLSEQAALEAASGFGNMLTQLGYTGDAALKASTSTVQLAADLGSFNNLDTGDVLERISAAMRGEYDSLQLLIPNINAARVEQEALAMSGKTAADALTAQEKAAATLAIIQRDGAAAANDFAETSDGLANSQKILNAEWQDAQARLGGLLVGPMTGMVKLLTNGLIPAFEGTVTVLGEVVGFLADNTELTLALAAALAVQLAGGITAVTVAFNRLILTPAVLGLSSLLGVVLSLPSALAAASRAVAGFLAAAAPLVAVGAVVYAIAKVVEFGSAAGDARDEIEGMWDAVDDASGSEKIAALEGMADTLQAKIRGLKVDIGEIQTGLLGPLFIAEHGAEITALEEYEQALARVEQEILAASGVVPLLGEAVAQTTAQSEEAQKALDAWLDELASISGAFVEPLDTYKGLLDEKTAKERESAEATAAATDSATDSWEDYASDVTVSLDELATQLEEQILAQENWRANIATITQRGGLEVGQILAAMGEEGVQLAAQMANGTDAEFRRMADLLIRDARLGGDGATAEMDRAMRVMAIVGRDGANATRKAIAAELGIGVGEVQRIAAQYGLNLASGINPILRSLGKPVVNLNQQAGRGYSGSLEYWDGGYTGDGGKFEPKGVVHGGEFVFTKEQTRKAGVGQLEVFAKMLDGYAGGGFVSTSDVPRPPSTAPYRMPISTAGDATMERAYGDTVDWLKANLVPQLSAGVGWQAMWDVVKRQFPGVVLHSGFRPGSITATGNLSYHAMGRAIDITPDMGIFNWLAANYGNSRELIFSPAGGRQIWNGRPHMYSEPTRGDHWDHIHWAMANGGVIGEPVFGVGLNSGDTYSFGERGPETVTPGVHGVGGGAAMYEGRLYLDSGQFLGVVRGELRARDDRLNRDARSASR